MTATRIPIERQLVGNPTQLLGLTDEEAHRVVSVNTTPERLEQLSQAACTLSVLFGDALAVRKFLSAKQGMLDGAAPLDYLLDGRADVLLELAIAADSGEFA